MCYDDEADRAWSQIRGFVRVVSEICLSSLLEIRDKMCTVYRVYNENGTEGHSV